MKIIFLTTLLFTFSFSNDIKENFSGAHLYNNCKPCHGKNAEKKVFSSSQAIGGWSAQRIVESIKVYKKRNGSTKYEKIMHGQVEKLSDKEIKILADYISRL